jgi:putative Mn2+ efflux pump MntP
VALLVLGYIGGKMVWEAIQFQEPAAVSGGLRTLLALGVATSIDGLAVGLLLAVLRVSLLVPILIIGVVAFVISYAGVVAGHELRRAISTWSRRRVQLLGGLILIGIGLQIVWEHLSRGSADAS